MRAVLVERAGGPEVLRPVDLAVPEPGAGEVRVRIDRIGVNFADVLCRRATHRSMRPPPIVPGCEGAGLIDACGPGVTRWSVGDRVGFYSPFGGAYAEALVIPQQYALPLPDAMSFDQAAAFTHLALTAHAALVRDPSPAGSTLLVTAAAGGLGGMVTQLGHALALTVIAAVGSDAKRTMLLARGLDPVIDYRAVRLDDAVLAATGGRGADRIVETVGGALFAQAQASLAPLGRIVIAGAASGTSPSVDVASLLDRSGGCTTLNLSVLYARAPEAMASAWTTLTGLFAEGRLLPRIGHRFPLAQAADAHRLIESRDSVDKILLSTTTD